KHDLLQSANAQRDFLWQVAREEFSFAEVLKKAAFDYLRFMELIAKDAGKITVPRYDIDLIWHTHMTSSPYSYSQFCTSVTGFVVDHDDSSQDITAGTKLQMAFQETCERWLQAHNEPYMVPGCEYRGEAPPEFWQSDWEPETQNKKSGLDVLNSLSTYSA